MAVTFALHVPRSAAAEDAPKRPELVFVADPKMGMETGIRSTESLGRLLFRYEEALPRGIFWEENDAPRKVAGVVVRSAKLLFLDFPIAGVEVTAIHEVFGHGARARDLGQTASYKLSIPQPYCTLLSPASECHSFTDSVTTVSGQRDRDLAVTLGGIEANLLTPWWIEEHTMETEGWLHHSDLLVYSLSKFVYSSSFLSRDLERSGGTGLAGDDVDHYVALLQDRFNRPTTDDRVSIAKHLRTAYLWNFADPMLYFAAYGTIRALYTGERFVRAPLPSAGGVRFLPAPRFGLSPFGAEHYLDLFLEKHGVVADVYGRIGSSGLASYSGGGVHLFGITPERHVSLGGAFDLWSQPATLLEARNDYARPNFVGGSLAAFGTLRVFGSLGLTGKLAYKTSGFLTGEPLGDGPYGYLGVIVSPPHLHADETP